MSFNISLESRDIACIESGLIKVIDAFDRQKPMHGKIVQQEIDEKISIYQEVWDKFKKIQG